MIEQPPTSIAKEKVASQLYFASLYFVTVGVLYLWGYWTPFGINILEYISLTDVLKATAYPIATALVMTAIGATFGEGLTPKSTLPPGGGRNTKVGVVLRKLGPFLAAVYVVGTGLFLAYGPVDKWNILPVMLALPVYMFAKEAGFLRQLIPHEAPRSIIIYVLASLPPLAYGRGVLDADKIQSGQAFTAVLSQVPGYTSSNEPGKQLRLIGHAGEIVFLFDPTKDAVVVAKLESGKPLVLSKQASAAANAPTALSPKATSSSVASGSSK